MQPTCQTAHKLNNNSTTSPEIIIQEFQSTCLKYFVVVKLLGLILIHTLHSAIQMHEYVCQVFSVRTYVTNIPEHNLPHIPWVANL